MQTVFVILVVLCAFISILVLLLPLFIMLNLSVMGSVVSQLCHSAENITKAKQASTDSVGAGSSESTN